MKRNLNGMLIAIMLLGVFIAGICFTSEANASGNRVIVLFDPSSSPAERRAIVEEQGCAIIKELRIVAAVVVHLPQEASDRAREAILTYAPVVDIEDDLIVEAFPKPDSPGGGKKPPQEPQPEQTLPWGIDRIDAELAWANSTGLLVKTAIVDTGIDTEHPDLVDNIAGGINIINPRKHYKDDNGHGTHVAGIVAAVDNTIGVVGVANRTSLYGVKVLDRNGLGWLSDVVSGLEWCINNGMDVVNMSLGTSSYSLTLHLAVIAVNDAGIVQVAAAGNNGGPVSYPAAYPETIAVSATDILDNVTSWSSYGPEIDLAAPGANINSTYMGGGYAVLSGTSMATPHVTGAAALIIENKPTYTPDQVLGVLTLTADNLGLVAIKQGAGLVDAEEAVLVTEF